MITRNAFALALPGFLLASGATAQTGASAGAPPPLTRAQVTQTLTADFKAADANGDGKLTKAEMEAALGKQAAEADAMVKEKLKADFDKLDTNKDGRLSLAEFQAVTTIRPRAGVAEQRIQQLDANKDGAISEAEFRGAALARFDKLDKNKDGTLTAAERSAESAPASRK